MFASPGPPKRWEYLPQCLHLQVPQKGGNIFPNVCISRSPKKVGISSCSCRSRTGMLSMTSVLESLFNILHKGLEEVAPNFAKDVRRLVGYNATICHKLYSLQKARPICCYSHLYHLKGLVDD